MKVLVAQSCPTLCDTMDCGLPGSSVQGILQARILEWAAIPCSRGSSWPRDGTQVSCEQFLYCLSHQESPMCNGEIIPLLQKFFQKWTPSNLFYGDSTILILKPDKLSRKSTKNERHYETWTKDLEISTCNSQKFQMERTKKYEMRLYL